MTTTATAQPHTGAVIDQLNGLLADSTVFYQKLRNYHWFVTGPHFFALHEKFEELYDDWAGKIDEIAERLGGIRDRLLKWGCNFQEGPVDKGKPFHVVDSGGDGEQGGGEKGDGEN